MNTETFSKTKVGKVGIKLLAKAMESRFRYRFYNADRILQGVDNLDGQNVLEIGCGTGFFTIPIARLIGDQGSLTSIDILQESVDFVSKKIENVKIENVKILKCDVLKTNLQSGSFQYVILFGVIPAPMLSLDNVLLEIHRVLKTDGTLVIWPPFPWLSRSIEKSGLFTYLNKKDKVYYFKNK
jgi:ubiquinone/menaquinone biosynthesis C-methylase UbiE